MTLLTNIISALANTTNVVFIAVLLGLFFLGWLKKLNIQPNLLMSVGILGTFVGIFNGLSGFDVNDIDGSVPALLSGMTTAFLSSLFGMTLGILLKLAQSKNNAIKEGVSNEDFYTVISEIKSAINPEPLLYQVQEINKSIIGDNESSIVTNLSKLRVDSNDNSKELIREFKQFAEEMTKNNMEALIKAIQTVMDDFNTKINDNLGDKFKELNKSVESLVVWQENNKGELDQLMAAQKLAADTLKKAEKSLVTITENSKTIPAIFDKTENVVRQLEAKLEAFATLKENAVSAFPVIQKNIEDLTSGFSKTVDNTLKQVDNAHKSIEKIAKSAEKSTTELNDSLVKTSEHLNETIENAVNSTSKHVEKIFKEVDVSLQNTLKTTSDSMHTQLTKLDEQMQDELQKAIEIMGGHLASISNKFVQDYTPLTEKLREVVQLANRVS